MVNVTGSEKNYVINTTILEITIYKTMLKRQHHKFVLLGGMFILYKS